VEEEREVAHEKLGGGRSDGNENSREDMERTSDDRQG